MKNAAPKAAPFLFSCVLALLVGHAAAGLASGLAGSLALAAAAVLGALAHVAGLQSLDSFHDTRLLYESYTKVQEIVPYLGQKVKGPGISREKQGRGQFSQQLLTSPPGLV
jgi:hypothetical protein